MIIVMAIFLDSVIIVMIRLGWLVGRFVLPFIVLMQQSQVFSQYVAQLITYEGRVGNGNTFRQK